MRPSSPGPDQRRTNKSRPLHPSGVDESMAAPMTGLDEVLSACPMSWSMSRRHECSKQDQDHHDVVAQLSLSLFFFLQFCKGAFSIPPRSVQHSAWWKEEAPVAFARVDGRADGLGGLGAWWGTGWWPGSAGTVMRIFARAERYPCTLPRYVPHLNPMRPHFPGRFVEGPLAKAPIPSPTHPNRLTPPHAGYHAPAAILWEAAKEEPGR